MVARRAAGQQLTRNFIANVDESVDVRAAGQFCPALAETFATAGASHCEPLWFTMLALAVFDHDPLGTAIAMSSGHPDYSLIGTQAKLEQLKAVQRDRDLGWTGCRAIAQHHPACAGCYYRDGSTGPLSLLSRMSGRD
jgi:hypothetical protein